MVRNFTNLLKEKHKSLSFIFTWGLYLKFFILSYFLGIEKATDKAQYKDETLLLKNLNFKRKNPNVRVTSIGVFNKFKLLNDKALNKNQSFNNDHNNDEAQPSSLDFLKNLEQNFSQKNYHNFSQNVYEDNLVFLVRSKSELLTKNYNLIAQIRTLLPLINEEYQELIIPLYESLANYIYFLPASESYHHEEEGGLFRHSLEVGLICLKLLDREVYPSNLSPLNRREERKRLAICVLLGGLLHDIGKVLTDMEVFSVSFKEEKEKVKKEEKEAKEIIWLPTKEGLYDFLKDKKIATYSFRYKINRGKKHETFGQIIIPKIINPLLLEYLLSFSSILEDLYRALNNEKNFIYQIFKKADMKSVELDLSKQYLPQTAYKRKPSGLKKFILILQDEIRTNPHAFNHPKGIIFLIDSHAYLSINSYKFYELMEPIKRSKLSINFNDPLGLYEALIDIKLAKYSSGFQGEILVRFLALINDEIYEFFGVELIDTEFLFAPSLVPFSLPSLDENIDLAFKALKKEDKKFVTLKECKEYLEKNQEKLKLNFEDNQNINLNPDSNFDFNLSSKSNLNQNPHLNSNPNNTTSNLNDNLKVPPLINLISQVSIDVKGGFVSPNANPNDNDDLKNQELALRLISGKGSNNEVLEERANNEISNNNEIRDNDEREVKTKQDLTIKQKESDSSLGLTNNLGFSVTSGDFYNLGSQCSYSLSSQGYKGIQGFYGFKVYKDLIGGLQPKNSQTTKNQDYQTTQNQAIQNLNIQNLYKNKWCSLLKSCGALGESFENFTSLNGKSLKVQDTIKDNSENIYRINNLSNLCCEFSQKFPKTPVAYFENLATSSSYNLLRFNPNPRNLINGSFYAFNYASNYGYYENGLSIKEVNENECKNLTLNLLKEEENAIKNDTSHKTKNYRAHDKEKANDKAHEKENKDLKTINKNKNQSNKIPKYKSIYECDLDLGFFKENANSKPNQNIDKKEASERLPTFDEMIAQCIRIEVKDNGNPKAQGKGVGKKGKLTKAQNKNNKDYAKVKEPKNLNENSLNLKAKGNTNVKTNLNLDEKENLASKYKPINLDLTISKTKEEKKLSKKDLEFDGGFSPKFNLNTYEESNNKALENKDKNNKALEPFNDNALNDNSLNDNSLNDALTNSKSLGEKITDPLNENKGNLLEESSNLLKDKEVSNLNPNVNSKIYPIFNPNHQSKEGLVLNNENIEGNLVNENPNPNSTSYSKEEISSETPKVIYQKSNTITAQTLINSNLSIELKNRKEKERARLRNLSLFSKEESDKFNDFNDEFKITITNGYRNKNKSQNSGEITGEFREEFFDSDDLLGSSEAKETSINEISDSSFLLNPLREDLSKKIRARDEKGRFIKVLSDKEENDKKENQNFDERLTLSKESNLLIVNKSSVEGNEEESNESKSKALAKIETLSKEVSKESNDNQLSLPNILDTNNASNPNTENENSNGKIKNSNSETLSDYQKTKLNRKKNLEEKESVIPQGLLKLERGIFTMENLNSLKSKNVQVKVLYGDPTPKPNKKPKGNFIRFKEDKKATKKEREGKGFKSKSESIVNEHKVSLTPNLFKTQAHPLLNKPKENLKKESKKKNREVLKEAPQTYDKKAKNKAFSNKNKTSNKSNQSSKKNFDGYQNVGSDRNNNLSGKRTRNQKDKTRVSFNSKFLKFEEKVNLAKKDKSNEQ
ncbi:MAG: TraI domain-containing protein [Succinivibrionaceae bacterium]|nr:TraI domain-containing protein [Succinivibrionaceae bacterium]